MGNVTDVSTYHQLQTALQIVPKTWLITGVAGFIGSNLLEALLRLDQKVIGIDNFSTGKKRNLSQVHSLVSESQWAQFHLFAGDIRDPSVCQQVCRGVDYVLHQAALGSVPRSIAEPLASHSSNVTGFLNMLVAARDQKVRRFVYASSSAVYGDAVDLPKVEDRIGCPLSPYAATKLMNEQYAAVFASAYGFESIGLRYFNVFGPRQDPDGAYAAVIPKWIAALLKSQPVPINGDGETSRDFCYVENVVQANLLAAVALHPQAANQVYNIAFGQRTTLNDLFQAIQAGLRARDPKFIVRKPLLQEFRPGDVRHSLANIRKAKELLGYAPDYSLREGLEQALDWYCRNSC